MEQRCCLGLQTKISHILPGKAHCGACVQGQGSCCTGSSGAPGCMAPLDCCKFRNTGCNAVPPVLAPAPAPLVSEAPAALPALVAEAPAPAPVVHALPEAHGSPTTPCAKAQCACSERVKCKCAL